MWSIILDGAKLFANNTGPNITLYTARITVTFISPVARPGRFERTSCTLSRTWPFSYPASLCPPSFSAPSFRNLYTKQHCLYTIRNIARPFPSSSQLDGKDRAMFRLCLYSGLIPIRGYQFSWTKRKSQLPGYVNSWTIIP